jgi:hypothetical protein
VMGSFTSEEAAQEAALEQAKAWVDAQPHAGRA